MNYNISLLAGLLLLLYNSESSVQQFGNASKPSVLFIMVDDLRDWTGYSDQFSNVKTPHLNQLAQQGTIFSSAYCAAPVCAPSRTALLTGLSPARTGIYTNGQHWPEDIRNHVTLTRHFMKEGYYTAGFGKIYHGQGDLQYWHHFIYGDYSPAPVNPPHPMALGNPLSIPDSLTGDGQRVNNAVKLLQSNIRGPVFLACGLVRPHTPWDVPEKYFDLYPIDSVEVPEVKEGDLYDVPLLGRQLAGRPIRDQYNGKNNSWSHQMIRDSGLWKVNVQAYLASITFADAQLGRLLDAWRQSRHSENGIVVLMGDHGWHHGEKEHWSKRTLWDVSTRTPLIIYAPGYSKPGDRCAAPVSLLDIYPTLIELCGLSPRNDLDGLSLRPLLENNDLPWDRPAITLFGKDNVALQTPNWRYIRYCDGSEELYDHNSDPEEYYNLAEKPIHRQVITDLRRWIPPCRDFAEYRGLRKNWFEENELLCR